MKFGKRLEEDLTHPGWEDYMIPYSKLKDIIRYISDEYTNSSTNADIVPEDTHPPTLDGSSSTSSSSSSIPESETIENKVDHYYEEVFLRTLLNGKENALVFIKNHFTLLLSQSNAVIDSIQNLPIMKRSIDKSSQMILSQFVIWFQEAQALRQFAITSQIALRKIVKKYLKQIPSTKSNSAIRGKIAKEAVLDIIPKEEDLYSLVKRGLDAIHAARTRDTKVFDTIKDIQSSYEAWIEKQIMRRTEGLEKGRVGKMKDRSMRKSMTSEKMRDEFTLFRSTTLIQTTIQRRLAVPMVYDVLKPEIGLLTAILLPILTFVITYSRSSTIFVDEEGNKTPFDIKGYFLSTSFDHAPASCYGAQGLSLTTFCLAVVIMIQHKIVKAKLRGRWGKFHRVSLAIGLISCWAAVGVASWQHQHSAVTHNTYAVIFFVFGVGHISMETFIDKSNELSPPFTIAARMILSMLTIVCCGIFITYAYRGSAQSIRETGERDFKLLFISAVAEIIMFLGLICYFITYLESFLQYEIELKVRPRKTFESTILLPPQKKFD